MRKYEDIPNMWFHLLLVLSLGLALIMCIFMRNEIQMPWWGLIFAALIALLFTLPISIITATTNQVSQWISLRCCSIFAGNNSVYVSELPLQTPGLNIITEYIMGIILPGRPIANVCFKTYGYMSMSQAVSFLNDFKLGHYMKIPPRSMFVVQVCIFP